MTERFTPKKPGASLPLVLSMGEPSGVGGEISLLAWQKLAPSFKTEALAPFFFLLDSPERLKKIAKTLNLTWAKIETIEHPEDAAKVFPNALPVLPLNTKVNAIPGSPSIENAPAVLESLERAVAFVQQNKASALVTNPIQKETLYQAGFAFPGHTEYLADKAKTDFSVMMLQAPVPNETPDTPLRTVPVTIHLPLKDVFPRLTKALLTQTIEIILKDAPRLSLPFPRIAVAGLNPHAGENGTLGTEEETIITPVIRSFQEKGVQISGPYPADTLFHAQARSSYDIALCMYHDQALIPVKTLNFHQGVNITLGLPFIRTSPDHGTALPLAGCGKACPDSLIEALHTAWRMILADHHISSAKGRNHG